MITRLLFVIVVLAFVARCEERKADPNDEALRVLAEKDKEKGAVSVGKDPAFILMPRPLERNESAQELMTPLVLAMIEKELARHNAQYHNRRFTWHSPNRLVLRRKTPQFFRV